MHARQSLLCHEPTTKGVTGGSSERKEESYKEILSFREYLSNTEHDVGRNMSGKGHSDGVSDGNKEHAMENWKKGQTCYKVTRNLAEMYFYSSVFLEVELASNNTGHLAEAIFKLLLPAYNKNVRRDKSLKNRIVKQNK